MEKKNPTILENNKTDKIPLKKEKLFDDQIETIPIPIILTSILSDYFFKLIPLENNNFKLEILSGNTTDLIGKNIEVIDQTELQKYIYPEDYGVIYINLVQVFEHKTKVRFEIRYIGLNSSVRWLEVNGIPQVDRITGEIVAIYGSLKDINEQKKEAEYLKKTQEEAEKNRIRFEQIASQSGEFIWEVNAEGIYTYVNGFVENMLGYSPSEIENKISCFDLMIEKHKEQIQNEVASFFKTGAPIQNLFNTIRAKDGHLVHVVTNGVPIKDENGKIIGYRGSDRDVTIEKEAENILKESEAKFRTYIEYSSHGVFALNENGTILDCNPAVEIQTGYCLEELKKMNLKDLLNHWERESLSVLFSENETVHDLQFKTKTGVVIDILWDIKKVNSNLYVAISTNITERKQIDLKLQTRLFYEKTLRSIAEESVIQTNLNNFINNTLKILGSTLKISRSYIFETDRQTGFLDNTYEWCAEGIVPQIDDLKGIPWDYISWWKEMLLETGFLRYANIEDIPDETTKEILRPQEIKSIVVVPLYLKDSLYGFIGFDDCLAHREWPDEDVVILQSISSILSRSIEIDISKEELLAEESKFRNLYETMAQGVVYQNTKGEIINANSAAIQHLDLEKSTIDNKLFLNQPNQFIKQDGGKLLEHEHPCQIALSSKVESSAVIGIENIQSKDQKWFKVFAKPEFKDGEEEPYQVFTTYEEITSLKNAICELKISKDTLEEKVDLRTKELKEINILQQAILDNAGLAIITTNENGVVNMFNFAAEKLLGYRSDEVCGKMNTLQFHQIDEMIVLYSKHKQETPKNRIDIIHGLLPFIKDKVIECHYTKKDGTLIPVKVSYNTITDEHGNLKGIIGVIMDATEEKKALEIVKSNEERLNSMFTEHAAVMMLINIKDGAIVQANKAAEKFYGLDFSSKQFFIHQINTLSEMQINEEIKKASENKINYFVFQHKISNGEIRTVEVHSTPIKVNSEIVLFSVIHDITDRNLFEEALKKSEAENRAIIKTVPDLLFRIDKNGVCLDCLSDNLQILNHPRENIFGGKLTELLPSNIAQKALLAIEQALSTHEVIQIEFSLIFPEGVKHYENRIVQIKQDEVLSIIRDITDRKNIEENLHETTQKLSILIKNMQSGTLFETSDRKTSLANQHFCDLFMIPVPPEQIIGSNCREAAQISKNLMEDPEGFINRIEDILENGTIVVNEELILNNGSVFERDYIPIYYREKLLGHLWQYRDITNRKKFEKSLKETITKEKELNDLKTRFVSMVSHEFRTPLSSILAANESLSAYWDRMTEEQRQNRMTKISLQVERLTHYIQDMLHLSKLQSKDHHLSLQIFDLVSLIKELVEEQNNISNESNRVQIESNLNYFETNFDKREMVSIVNNLISNALKYSESHTTVKVNLIFSTNNFSIIVSDQGIGIPQEEILHLFNPFFRATNTTGIPGTGLGLPIVKEAVDRHNGTISVESEINVGTKFNVTIPII